MMNRHIRQSLGGIRTDCDEIKTLLETPLDPLIL
jgi:hypothetical protein